MKRKVLLIALIGIFASALLSDAIATAQGPLTPKPQGKGVITVTEGESIQDAIDKASDGDRILVYAGTYVERIKIDGKDLTLVAVGDVVIEEPNPDETQWPDPISTVRIENSRSTIEGFTVDVKGGWSGIYAIGGPYYENGEVEVTVKNNKVIDYNRNGITVNGKLAEGKIFNNIVIGENATGWANNGIQIGFGATGIIKGNFVDTNWWIGDRWTATGILLYDVEDVQVIKNELKDNQLGIGILGNNTKIVNNKLDYGLWGIGIYEGSINNKGIRNTITDYDYEIFNSGQESKIHANVLQ